MFQVIKANKFSISRRRPILDIGINDADYLVKPTINGKKYICPFYAVWTNMLQRVFDAEYHRKSPKYKGCTVDESWLVFSNFKKWMKSQDYKGKQIDKDYLVKGNKHYSPETCVFVSHAINSLLLDNETRRGSHPIGVTLDKRNGKYQAKCKIGKRKHVHLGLYKTMNQAHNAYCRFKAQRVASESRHQEPKLERALLKISGEILSNRYHQLKTTFTVLPC